MSELASLLASHHGRFHAVIPFDLRSGGLTIFDFTESSPDFAQIDVNDVMGFTDRLFALISTGEVPVGIGRYDEDRVLYRHSPLFDGETEQRSLHLGIDLFAAAGTAVMAPLPAVVHSVADNRGLGDYGPTVILGHTLESTRFWTLYGHLGRHSVHRLEVDSELAAGDSFAEIGDSSENGGWPPHLHFQIVAEVGDHRGDFPGVAPPSERLRWLERCPDPNLILGIPGL